MSETKLYRRAELVELSGAPDDVVGFWLRNDLLQSYVSGDRKHRRFQENELKFAMLLGEMRAYGMNVRAMSMIVGRLRDALAYAERIGPPARYYPDVLNAVASADSDIEAGLRELAGASNDDVAEAVRVASKIDPRRVDDLWLALCFESGDDSITIERTGGEFRLHYGAYGSDGRTDALHSSVLIINLARVFARLTT